MLTVEAIEDFSSDYLKFVMDVQDILQEFEFIDKVPTFILNLKVSTINTFIYDIDSFIQKSEFLYSYSCFAKQNIEKHSLDYETCISQLDYLKSALIFKYDEICLILNKESFVTKNSNSLLKKEDDISKIEIETNVKHTEVEYENRACLQLLLKQIQNDFFKDLHNTEIAKSVFFLTNKRFQVEQNRQQLSNRKYSKETYLKTIDVLKTVILQLQNDVKKK